MIDVLATINVGDVPLTLFGKIDESKHRIELNYQIISEASMKLSEIIYNPKLDLAVLIHKLINTRYMDVSLQMQRHLFRMQE